MQKNGDGAIERSPKLLGLALLALLTCGGVYVAANLYNDYVQNRREPDALKRQLQDIERRVEQTSERLDTQVKEVERQTNEIISK